MSVPEENVDDGTVREEIVVPEHATPSQMATVMAKIARVANAMAGRAIIGGAFGGAGCASPMAQQMIQCAASAGTAAAMLHDAARQVFGVVPHPQQKMH